MGKKKEAPVEVPVVAEEADGEEEDTPVIKSLKEIDDKYCSIEVELEREIELLRKKFDERQAPLLEERTKVLSDSSDCPAEAKEFGTPACPEFWATALGNAGDIEECLHECDEPVLKYLHDIQKIQLDPNCAPKGHKFEFTFKENPYFTNTVLWFEVHCAYDLDTYKPYKEPECLEVKSCTIDWKPGKNVTVEKKKDGPSKKGKQKKAGKVKEEPCPSFFRIIFTNVKKDDPLPEGLECIYSDEDDDDGDMTEIHLDNMSSVADFLAQGLLPYAVRYYTGEACEDDDDDDEESEEEEEDFDDDEEDEDDDDESEEPPPKKGGKKKAPAAAKKGGEAGEKTEECKQQ